jgi:sigma-B regulation protein RsbU (phosphoserine phosphatase)
MIYRARTGAVEIVGAEGTVLGFLPKPRNVASQIELHEGDAMLLYTDGLVEAIDERGEMFGEGRLEAAFAKTASKSPKECLSALVAAVVAFRDRNAHRDDITAVVIRANSREGERS